MGDMVFNERIDKFDVKGKPMNGPVCGVFKVKDGKIVEWRDYGDSGRNIKEGSLANLAGAPVKK